MNDAKAKAYAEAAAAVREQSVNAMGRGDYAVLEEMEKIAEALERAAKARSESP